MVRLLCILWVFWCGLVAANVPRYATLPLRGCATPTARSVMLNGASVIVSCACDPNVEFLVLNIEVRQGNASRSDWLTYGSEISGDYPGMQDVGGLDSTHVRDAGHHWRCLRPVWQRSRFGGWRFGRVERRASEPVGPPHAADVHGGSD